MIASRTARLRSRRGFGLFVMVLGTSLLVSLLGLAAMLVMRIERRDSERSWDMHLARRYAQAAVEMGMLRIKSDPDWRTTFPSGVWESDRSVGDGSYTLEGVDPVDDDLSDSMLDPAVMTGTGVRGAATQIVEVTLVRDPQGLSCLESALHAGNNVTVSTAAVTCDQIISANSNVDNVSGTINSDVEAVNSVTGAINGTVATGVAPRTMPDATRVFDHYLANGTAIPYSSLVAQPSYQCLEDIVLSPNSNPFGATNPEGIYVVDCQFQQVRVQHSRIVGTLVLLDPDPNSRVDLAVNWEPAVASYPALLVRGSIQLRWSDAPLDEAARGVNFNPSGTPYDGFDNADMLDVYPSQITGLVYVSGDVLLASKPTIDGVLIVGDTLTSDGTLNLTYRPEYLSSAPPGFDTGAMMVAPGSWKKSVN